MLWPMLCPECCGCFTWSSAANPQRSLRKTGSSTDTSAPVEAYNASRHAAVNDAAWSAYSGASFTGGGVAAPYHTMRDKIQVSSGSLYGYSVTYETQHLIRHLRMQDAVANNYSLVQYHCNTLLLWAFHIALENLGMTSNEINAGAGTPQQGTSIYTSIWDTLDIKWGVTNDDYDISDFTDGGDTMCPNSLTTVLPDQSSGGDYSTQYVSGTYTRPGTNWEDQVIVDLSSIEDQSGYKWLVLLAKPQGSMSKNTPTAMAGGDKAQLERWGPYPFSSNSLGFGPWPVSEILDLASDVNGEWSITDPSGLDKSTRYPLTPSGSSPVEVDPTDDNEGQEWTLDSVTEPHGPGTITATVYAYMPTTTNAVTFTAELYVDGAWTTPVNLSWASSASGWRSAELATGLSASDFSGAKLRLTSPVMSSAEEFEAIYVHLTSSI